MVDVINFIANSLTITVLVGYLFALWAALVIWTWFDISGRTDNPLYRIGAILIVATGAVFGFAIYLLLRPSNTLEEAGIRDIEETILASQSQFLTCPACHHTAREDFVYCPNCSTKLLSGCPDCGKQINVSWNTCPYCGKERKKVVEIAPEVKPELKPAEVPSPVVIVSEKKGRSLAFFSALSGFLKRRNAKKPPKKRSRPHAKTTFGESKNLKKKTSRKKS